VAHCSVAPCMSRLPRTLTPIQGLMKKIGITKYERFERPIMDCTMPFRTLQTVSTLQLAKTTLLPVDFRVKHIKDSMKDTKTLIEFSQEAVSGWKMISDIEVKGMSSGEFSIENGIGTSPNSPSRSR